MKPRIQKGNDAWFVTIGAQIWRRETWAAAIGFLCDLYRSGYMDQFCLLAADMSPWGAGSALEQLGFSLLDA